MGEDGLRQLGGFLRMEVKLQSQRVANETEFREVRVDTVVVVEGGSRLAKVHNFRSSR